MTNLVRTSSARARATLLIFSRWLALALTLAALTLGAPRRAAAAPSPHVITPGHDAAITEMIRAALEEATPAGEEAPRFGVAIERDVLRVRVFEGDDAGPSMTLVVGAPGAALEAAGSRAIADAVALRCDPACSAEAEAAARARAEALTRRRDAIADTVWKKIERPPEPTPGVARLHDTGQWTYGDFDPAQRWSARLALAYALLWALACAAARLYRRRRALLEDLRRHAPLLLVIAGFLGLCAALPDFLPIHDHNTYVARCECARSLTCDEDVRGAFSAPIFHVYGLLLQLVPPGSYGNGIMSVACSALAITLLYALIRRVVRVAGPVDASTRALAASAAIWAAGFAAFHPLMLRTATSGILWPYNVVCVLAAGVAATRFAARGRIADALAAAVLFALAVLGNLVCLALAPLVVLVPLCWRPRGEGARRSVALGLGLGLGVLVFALLVAPTFLDVLANRIVRGDGADRFDQPLGRLLWWLLSSLLYFDYRLTPAPLGILALLGVVGLARRRARVDVPFVYLLLATDIPLTLQVVSFTEGYPTRFIHGYPALLWFAALAGLGAALLVTWLKSHVHRAPAWALRLGLAGLCVVAIPTAYEGLAFTRGSRALGREVAALERSFAALPEHDALVLPPVILPPPKGIQLRSDPVEAFFPMAPYRAAMRARGQAPIVARLDDLLALETTRLEHERVLVYLGVTLHSFAPEEISAGMAARSYERPLLQRLRARYELEPALTFSISTEQHPAVAMRLAADRVDAVELGFYWLTPRP